jgi:hypothetical protein
MGKEYPADEAGKWGQEIDGISRKFQGEVRNALTEAAGRGFPAPPGPVLELIVATGLAAKFKAAEVNAKLYQGLTDRRLKEEEVDLKVVLGLAKLDLEVLKADYDNAHDLAQALEDKNLSEKRATIQKLQSDVDKRQAYIIEERANIEHEVNYWKRLAIQAEGIALDAEVQLAQEKLKTAEEKLRIITYLYQVIAAEQVALVAEQRRAETLQIVIEKEKEVVEIKKTMIPLYKEKSAARLEQAEAIKDEAAVKKEIEELGYRRIELKRAQEEADHQVRQAEEDFEEAHLAYVRADRLTELTRAKARTLLLDYEGQIKEKLIKMKKALDKEERRLKLDQKAFWESYGWGHEFDYTELQRQFLVVDFYRKVTEMIAVGMAKYDSTLAGQRSTVCRTSAAHMHQYISKGTG